MLGVVWSRVRDPLRRVSLLGLVVFLVFVAMSKVAYATGLAEVDYASHSWTLAIIGALGISSVASTVTAIFDRAAAATGWSTSALMWLVCGVLAVIMGVIAGDLPAWTGDPDVFFGDLVTGAVKWRMGATLMHGLFIGRLGWIKALRAPSAKTTA